MIAIVSGVIKNKGKSDITVLTSSGIGYKIFASKYDSLGNYVWGRIIASSAGYAWSNTVTLDIAGNPIVVGNFTGIIDLAGSTLTSSGGFDIFIWKLAK